MNQRRVPTILLGLCIALMLAFGLAAAPERVKLQVNDPALAERLRTEFGGRLVADYGAYQLLEVDWQAAADVAREPGQLRCDEYDHIALNTGWLPTAPGVAPARKKTLEVFSGKRLHLVQFAGPIQPRWFEELQATGAQVVTYIPHNAYLVYADAGALGRVQALADAKAYVQWEGAYLVDYRIQPGAVIEAPEKTGEPLPDAFTFQMVQDPKANQGTLALIQKYSLGKSFQDYSILNYRNVTVLVPEERLPEIAARPDVVSVQPWYVPELHDERQDQIMRNYLTGNVPTGPGYLDWLLGLGFTSQQFITSAITVDVTDSGIDDASITPNHFALWVEGVLGGTPRVAYSQIYGTPGSSAGKGCDGHGNLNAHIVAGYNTLTGAYHEDASGYNYGLGVCPWARVGSSVIFDPGYTNPPSFATLQNTAYASGARISTNSWGAAVGGAYNSDSQTYDTAVRDAQSGVDGNQEMVILFSAGNSGSGPNTIGSPGTGKNVFTVGAAENVHPFGGADQCGIADTGADNANDVISFSSRGPCDDGRIKPDIQAPGTHISGGVFQVASPPAAGDADACFDASGVCGGPAASPNFWPTTSPTQQEWTTASSGTSHSTPAMAGAAALLRQWFLNHSKAVPSPALNKAWLMNSTRYMTGVGANDNLYSNSQGMGEVDLTRAFDAVPRVMIDQAQVFTASGQTQVITGNVQDGGQPFRVTLAWTDPPGPTSGNAYINNLDLTVTVGGSTYYGNVFSGANSATGGTADLKNNVESVFIPAGVTGAYTVTITATNLAGDGVPGNQSALDQDYALVIYNANEVQQPVISAESATLEAEGCNPANGVMDPGESITYTIVLKNVGTASTTNLVAALQATGGVTSPGGAQTYGALAPGASASMPFTFVVDPALACGDMVTLTLHLTDGATDMGNVSFGPYQTGVDTTVVILSENFDGVTTPALPANWLKTDIVGTNGDWYTNVGTRYPSGQPAHSGTNLVLFNSYTASNGNSTRMYYDVALDWTTYAGMTLPLSFWMYHDTGYTTDNDRVQVQMSTNGGSGWTDVGTAVSRYNGSTGWAQHTIDLSAYAGMSNLKLAFHGISDYGNDCHIDDIAIQIVQPRVCCEGPTIPKGDLNHDYAVDGADLLILANYLGGAELPPGTDVSECELVTDGVVNSADLAWLQNKVAGNI
jgi:hypothetical protein